MCGIAGMWLAEGAVNQDELQAMIATLHHRGPDDVGQWSDGGVGLAQSRLSILDVSLAGHQPMATPDGRFSIVFNGEIFNYRELAQQYLSDVKFVSTSDTEVLLHLWARYGERTVVWLRGMYAFAIWDAQKQELVLVRDPFGKKPLYYQQASEGVLFASEPKALLVGRAASPITSASVTSFMSYEYMPAPHTAWSDIQQVPMGTCRRWTAPGASTAHRFWRPSFTPKRVEAESVLITHLDALLRTSVERRLVSDVPVGLLLSGGLDSTTIGWYMKNLGAKHFHSFSVSFDEASFDESRFASEATSVLGTQHHNLLFTLDTFRETLRELIPLMDIPLADASLLPTYAISKMARQHVTVLLDGDGSDELFGGYGTFRAAEVAEKVQWLAPVASALRALANALPTRYHDFSFDFKLKSFLRGFGFPLVQRNQAWLGSFTEQELPHLLQSSWYDRGAVFAAMESWQEELKGLSTIDQVSLATIYQYLHNDILVKLDRATMGCSVEARTPFLDIDVADFAFKLPDQYKRDKYILKQLMTGRIPDSIVRRKKKGFGIPLGLWLRGPLYEWGREILAQEKIESDGILQWPYVDQLWREHKEGKADHRKKLWTLLTWQLWYDQWVAGRS